MTYETFSFEETKKIAFMFGEKAKKGQIICLSGDLGTGKTVFTKGFADGLQIKSDVTSPTFTIINEYTDGLLPLYHFDVYRINSVDEMEDCGYEDYFFGEGVCLVEWAELIETLIPDYALWVKIEKDPEKQFDYRKITVKGWDLC